LGGAGVATIRGRRVPEVSLSAILGLESEVDEKDRTLIVLRPAGGDLYALSVDRIHDHEELVVKPAAPAVMATGLYAGTTLADDGSPILLFDPGGLAQVGGVKLEAQERATRIAEASAAAISKATPVLLFRALDGSRRALRLAVVDRIEEVPASAVNEAAGQLRVQVGEAILPLAGAADGDLGDGKVRLFRLNDGAHEIGYAFAEVIDFATIDNEIIHAERPGEVSGVSLINGQPAELVDAHWLFAAHVGAVARAAEQLICRLPGDDAWMQNMLRPIVEAAGYRVVGDDYEGDANLVIAAQGAEVAGDAAQTIWLRTEPDATGKKDQSIYRYDRAGLLMALKTVGAAAEHEPARAERKINKVAGKVK
jgi:two-component system chemotaxis sensor kinase CheA